MEIHEPEHKCVVENICMKVKRRENRSYIFFGSMLQTSWSDRRCTQSFHNAKHYIETEEKYTVMGKTSIQTPIVIVFQLTTSYERLLACDYFIF